MRRTLTALLALALAVTACGSDGSDGSGAPDSGAGTSSGSTTSAGAGPAPTGSTAPATTGPATTPMSSPPTTGSTTTATPDLGAVALDLEPVVSLTWPIDAVTGPGDALHVATKDGQLYRLGGAAPELLLDLGGRVSTGGEQGLLGIAFLDGWLYADYTDEDGDSVLAAWRLDGAGVPDPASETTILTVDQPYANHNGGDLAVGPDGLLWWALGDGGSGGDPHGNGQDPASLLGKLLRIRPTPDGPSPYEIPDDNPFVAGGGAGEVFAFGLRNPWRIDFDPVTGDLWVADVGQDAREEVDHVPATELAAAPANGGLDFAWNRMEGDQTFAGTAEPDDIVPVHTYGHDEGRSISGGVVYRGTAIPGLAGAYLFGDYAGGFVDAVAVAEDGTVEHRRLLEGVGEVVSFGTDAAGEVLVVSLGGDVWRLVPA